MSIDGRGPSLNRSAENTISALKSKLDRRDEKIAELKERVAVLESIAQAHADDRDSYAERAVELEDERDRARSTAVAFEQQVSQIQDRVGQLQKDYTRHHLASPSPSTAGAVDVLAAVDAVLSFVTDVVLSDLIEEDEAAA